MGFFRWLPMLLLICTVSATTLYAQSPGAENLHTGKAIWEAGCAGCHGNDGRGAPESTLGFTKPDSFPDFSRCDQTTSEYDVDYKATIRGGGLARGFSTIMPSFADSLTEDQIDEVVRYIRGFCKQKGWPRAELNLPRAIVTEKAYPEDEEVVTASLNATGAPGLSTETVHEQRFGKRNEIEVSVPIDFVHPSPGLWYGGFGDVGLGLKRVLFSNDKPDGSIFSLQGEAIFPTGNRPHGLGSGVMTFETFAAFGQILPWNTFVQLQGGADLPVDTSKAPQSTFFRGAFGKSMWQNHRLGRWWTPMVELLGSRDLVTGARTDLDVMPEMQVTLSARQHIRADLGYSIPTVNTAGRSPQVMFYVLWDWQDGKLTEGW
jgi:mono/diheme cytochrome c family protein